MKSSYSVNPAAEQQKSFADYPETLTKMKASVLLNSGANSLLQGNSSPPRSKTSTPSTWRAKEMVLQRSELLLTRKRDNISYVSISAAAQDQNGVHITSSTSMVNLDAKPLSMRGLPEMLPL